MKMTLSDRIVLLICYVLAIIALIITLYPFLYVFSASISDPIEVQRGNVLLLPRGFTLQAYINVLAEGQVIRSFFNSVWYTVVGTITAVSLITLTAYPLSRKEFHLRNFFQIYILIPMFFSGGLIPSFLVVNGLGLYNTRWAVILTLCLGSYHVILSRTYLQTIPDELIESARLDGCSEFRIFLKIIIPLATPITAVITVYNAIGYWNNYLQPLIYLKSEELQPLTIYLNKILSKATLETAKMLGGTASGALLSFFQIKYAVIIVAIAPIMIVYPIFQKQFTKGIMIGALKG
ncbi:MAG: carbohydrate ABC transporter permease [Clostridiaceae bacterium]|nr:carbohydrate ABC transporter permease [Clostridiaceae bacterium]